MEQKEHQPPLTVEQQLENLKALGLNIENEAQAIAFLNDVSYFRLIKAYSLGFKPKNGRYFENVSFDTIKELYLFNSNFRQLLFPLIEQVEINLRCRVANYFCEKYGIFGYLDEKWFQNADFHASFLLDFETELSRNEKSPFVKNYRENYVGGNIPLYAAIELFSFGTLSKFYKNMIGEDKKAIAAHYSVGYTYLESWFESISYVRNICAHYGRLYNAILTKRPILYRQYANINNGRIFAVLICLKHLLPHDRHWREFVDTLELMLDKYPHAEPQRMGFPELWKDYLLQDER